MDRVEKRRQILDQIWAHCVKNQIFIETLAKRTGFKPITIGNAFAGAYAIKLDDLIKLAEAAGCKIVIEDIKNLK